MLDEYDMLPCPKCGKDGWLHNIVKGYEYRRFYVRCEDCGHNGGVFRTKHEAVKAWNEQKGVNRE